MSSKQMSVLDHLVELRSRLFKSVMAILGFAVTGLIFSKQIYSILQKPLVEALPEGSNFIATRPFESYLVYFKVALVTGFFLATPVIFYQLWRFLTPGLHQKEKRYFFPFALGSAILFCGGALFGYFVVFPTGFHYVNLVLEGTAIRLLPGMSEYFGFATALLFAFGVTFELPLFIFLLGKLGLIRYNQIKKYRRYVIVGLFILAALLTPGPDVISQCLMAIPLWGLYELGGLSLKLIR